MAVAERLLAIQGQDARGFRLAVRARTRGLTAADVERCLGEERSLLVTWVNRGTLHLIRSEDYPWLHALTTPPLLTGCMRRLAQEGVEPGAADRAVDVIERALIEEGPLAREQLRDRLRSAGLRTEGQALIHLVFLASLRGVCVRGPMIGKQHAYVLVRDWLGEAPPVDRDRALAELARRYLAGHGPAGDRDLAKWAGLPLRDARAGLEAIAGEVVEREDGLVELARGGSGRGGGAAPPPAELPPPVLLGAFDPCLLGWATREPIVGEHDSAIVSGGIFRPFALVKGRVAGVWRLERGAVKLEPLERIARADAEALDADAADVRRFLK
ncbi:MAG TPA: winged helix DNA-binding domain-containing protein [Thermoleophilaceae bacterium]